MFSLLPFVEDPCVLRTQRSFLQAHGSEVDDGRVRK